MSFSGADSRHSGPGGAGRALQRLGAVRQERCRTLQRGLKAHAVTGRPVVLFGPVDRCPWSKSHLHCARGRRVFAPKAPRRLGSGRELPGRGASAQGVVGLGGLAFVRKGLAAAGSRKRRHSRRQVATVLRPAWTGRFPPSDSQAVADLIERDRRSVWHSVYVLRERDPPLFDRGRPGRIYRVGRRSPADRRDFRRGGPSCTGHRTRR